MQRKLSLCSFYSAVKPKANLSNWLTSKCLNVQFETVVGLRSKENRFRLCSSLEQLHVSIVLASLSYELKSQLNVYNMKPIKAVEPVTHTATIMYGRKSLKNVQRFRYVSLIPRFVKSPSIDIVSTKFLGKHRIRINPIKT